MVSALEQMRINREKSEKLKAESKPATSAFNMKNFGKTTLPSKPQAQVVGSKVTPDATQPLSVGVGATATEVSGAKTLASDHVEDSPDEIAPLEGESNAVEDAKSLPEGIDEQQIAFVESLRSLEACFEDVDLVPQIIRTILVSLQEHPEFIEMLSDENRHQMMKGTYKAMGIARASKAKKVSKKSPTKASAKAASAAATREELGFDDMFKDM